MQCLYCTQHFVFIYSYSLWFDLISDHICLNVSKRLMTLSVFHQKQPSHLRCPVRKGVLGNFAKFLGKYLCQILFFNKVAGLRHKCFPVNIAKILRTHLLQNTSGRLLLFHHIHHSETSLIIYIWPEADLGLMQHPRWSSLWLTSGSR